MANRFDLPPPSDDALAHSRRVAGHIAERIHRAGGWIDFSEFMDLALYAPGLGYYSAGAEKFGPAGDFVTAPEISALFGRCLANACCAWLRDSPDAVILELGAGSGALAAEVLGALQGHGVVPARYLILEVSAGLRRRQQDTLQRLPQALSDTVEWLDELPQSPLRAIILANEVADALPVTRFRKLEHDVMAQGVSVAGDGFAWAERPAGRELRAAVAAIESGLGRELDNGYTSEVSLRLPAWIDSIARIIEAGAFLVCDYGMARREYYHPERRDGTLLCHYRHRAHADPFLHPGLQDISAWVDFTAAAAAADATGLSVAGYSTQAHFLVDNGVLTELERLQTGQVRDRVALAGQARRLLMPGEMGERFKVLAATRGRGHCDGFGFRDLRHLL